MTKKTLQQYQREFEELEKESITSIKLAEACIEDFPEEELGFETLGNYLANLYITDIKYHEIIKDFENKAIIDSRYGLAIGKFYLIITMLTGTAPEMFLKENKYYKNAWLADGISCIIEGNNFDGAKSLNMAFEYGIDLIHKLKNVFVKLNPPLSSIKIQNYLSLKNIEISKLNKLREIYFLGENGVGKTAFLQAILLNILHVENEIVIKYPISKDKCSVLFSNSEGEDEPERIISYLNIFAYGISRFRSSPKFTDAYGYATLFDHDTYLTNPEEWLKDVQRRELLGKSSIKLSAVIQMLTDVINFEGNEFRIEYDARSDNFVFIEKNTPTKFEHLADGYRSVLVWLCDLLFRLSKNQTYITDIKDFGGLVLIDEIDMLLHPKWEYTIVKKLREKFPRIQWFFTTHSPLLIMGASEDAVFYKLYKENGETKISEQWKCSDIDNMLANSILTSPLFDLESARMRAFDETKKEVDTNSNYWYSRIEKVINEERAKQKEAGKQYFSEQEIDDMVRKAIEQLKNEVSNG